MLGLLSMVTVLPGLFAPLIAANFLMQRIGEKKTLVVSFVFAIAGCTALPLSSNLPTLYASQFIQGIGCTSLYSLLAGLSIKNVESSRRATAMGFFQAVYGIGMFLGPFVSGVVGNWFGLSAAFYLAGVFGLGGLCSVLVVWRKRAFTHKGADE